MSLKSFSGCTADTFSYQIFLTLLFYVNWNNIDGDSRKDLRSRVIIVELSPHICSFNVRCVIIGFLLNMLDSVGYDVTLCSPVKFTEISEEFQLFIVGFMLVLCLASSTLKMETVCSSETSVDFNRTTWRYVAEDTALCIQRVALS
jgi:hypothetical protein